jgi:hypothetical protein
MNYIIERFWWRTKIKLPFPADSLAFWRDILPCLKNNAGIYGIDWVWEFDKVKGKPCTKIVIKFRPGLSKTATLFLLRYS